MLFVLLKDTRRHGLGQAPSSKHRTNLLGLSRRRRALGLSESLDEIGD
jgi:hypothetical protein